MDDHGRHRFRLLDERTNLRHRNGAVAGRRHHSHQLTVITPQQNLNTFRPDIQTVHVHTLRLCVCCFATPDFRLLTLDF